MNQSINNSLGLFADRKIPQDTYFVTAESVTLTPRNNIVRVVGQAAAVTLTLPPVADCAGVVFAITAAGAFVNNVTITHQGDSLSWANIVLNANEEGVVLWCDGRKFWLMAGP